MERTEANDITPEAIETVPSLILGTHITGMDPSIYKAAFEGNVDAFNQIQDIERQLTQLQLTPKKNTVLHVHFTAQTVSEEFVQFIRNSCPSLVLQANSKGETPLHIAARYGHLAAVKMLIEAAKTFPADLESGIGAEKRLIRATNEEGDSALHEAVRYNHIHVVRHLTKEDPDHSYSANKDGETPLYIAVERSYKDIVGEILRNCESPAYGGPKGRTALHSAVLHEDKEMVEGLLEKGHLKSSIREADELGCVPLHLAAQKGKVGLTKLLLEHDRKTAYMRDKEGRTALHLAARKCDRDIIEMILSECPDCAEIADDNGQNALHYAVSHGNYKSAMAIIEKLSLSNLYNEKDADGNTPLHLSPSLKGLSRAGSELTKHPRVDKLAFNKLNRTAYDIACDHNLKIRPDLPLRNILHKLKECGARKISSQRIQTPAKNKDDDDCNKDSRNINKNDEDALVKRAKDSHLVVATLIATVTFAAGFTLPGGTFQEGEHQGTPILKNNPAFRTFIFTDTVAMVLSATAVLFHMFLAINPRKDARYFFLMVALGMTIVAMASMMIAFVTGIFAMLGVYSGLGICIILFGLYSFVYSLAFHYLPLFGRGEDGGE